MNAIVPIPVADFERNQRNVPVFARTNTTTIMATVFPPIGWIVEGYVAEGLSILAGRQKLGKTWLALDWAIAVACGGMAMGSIECDQGDVLYIDLENGHRRIQSRIKMLFPRRAAST
jgi:RecA-family ATPase